MVTIELYKRINKKYNFVPSHYELLKHLFIDTCIFMSIYFLLQKPGILSCLAVQLLWAVLFFRFFGLMHDSVHQCLSKNVKLNNFIGHIAGAFCFLPYYPWKKMHLQHHRWAGNVEKDPVMKMIRDYDSSKKFKNAFLGFAWKSWIPILAFMQHTIFWFAGIAFFKEAKTFKAKLNWTLSYIIPGFIYYQLYKMNMFTLTNVGSGLLIYLVMVEIINFPHHLELPQNKGETTLPVWEQYQISRSCSYSKIFARYVLNNFNYHSEHHMFPKAPWYMLDKLQTEIRVVLGDKYNHSKSNAWILRNRKKSIQSLLIYKQPVAEILENEKKSA